LFDADNSIRPLSELVEQGKDPGAVSKRSLEDTEALRDEDRNLGKRRRVITKADVLKALSDFKDPSLCHHSSYSDSLNLDDERINGSDIDCFVIFGEQLPFTGRGSELGLLANRIETDISIWSRWRNEKLDSSLATADEISKAKRR
jgi:hypothetical protein